MKRFSGFVFGLLVVEFFCVSSVRAESITSLGQQADLIVLARLQTVSGDGTGAMTFHLQVGTTLKGIAPTGGIIAILPASGLMAQNRAGSARGPIGTSGLWFLKQSADSTYLLLSTQEGGSYTENDAFWPMPDWWAPSSTDTLAQQLLSGLSAWYRSLPSPNIKDEYALLGSLDNSSDPEKALSIAEDLMASADIDQQVLGFAAAIRMGSDEAITRLGQDVQSLRLSKKFSRITEALSPYYQPHGAASIAALYSLISLHSDVPGLDVAAEKALARIGNTSYTPPDGPGPALPAGPGTPTKQVLPILIELLDSRDEQAQLGAARLLAQFTVLANPKGEIVQGVGAPHPFRSDDTIRYMPRKDSTISTAEYVSFWKSWWAQNRAKLGSPPQ